MTPTSYHWIYGKDGKVYSPQSISRFELNEQIYQDIYVSKEAGKAIGFREKAKDAEAEAFDYMDSLDKRGKTIMFRQLAKELGYDISKLRETETSDEKDDSYDSSEQFDSDSWQSEEFPQRRIRNLERLIEHVRQEFFCADPVRYQKVLRQIRTSKSPRTIRAYSLGMYQNESDLQICQMCKKSVLYVDVTEIANYGIEMPQLNLCLCRNCSSRYKQFRDGNKERFKAAMTKALREIDINIPSEEYEIALSSENSIFFTQTHLAEIKEILSLLEQYGVPGKEYQSEQSSNSYGKEQTNKGTEDTSAGSPGKQSQKSMERDTMTQHNNHEKDVSNNPENAHHNKDFTRNNMQGDYSRIMQGDIVNHKSYGRGKIKSLKNPYVEVFFQSVGIKKFRFPDAFREGYLTIC